MKKGENHGFVLKRVSLLCLVTILQKQEVISIKSRSMAGSNGVSYWVNVVVVVRGQVSGIQSIKRSIIGIGEIKSII